MLGYPEAALADADHALKDAREIGQAATLMYALRYSAASHFLCGNFVAANAQADELVALADEKGAVGWKGGGMMLQGCVLALTGKASDAVDGLPPGITLSDQREQQYFCRCIGRIWPAPMRTLANSTMLGAALAKR